jgi:hypothetical protein
LSGWDQVDRAKAPGIIQCHPPTVVSIQKDVIVRVELGGIDTPLPRHAKVKDQGIAAIGLDQSELPATAKPDDLCASQSLAEVVGKGAPQILPAKLDPLDAAAKQDLFQAANGGLDFGELGHPGHMANVGAAS